MSTSFVLAVGFATSRSCRTSGGPYFVQTMAFMRFSRLHRFSTTLYGKTVAELQPVGRSKWARHVRKTPLICHFCEERAAQRPSNQHGGDLCRLVLDARGGQPASCSTAPGRSRCHRGSDRIRSAGTGLRGRFITRDFGVFQDSQGREPALLHGTTAMREKPRSCQADRLLQRPPAISLREVPFSTACEDILGR